MSLWEQFIGPAYRTRSQSIAADALINLYPEITENGQEAKKASFYGTPGLKLFLSVSTTGCRGSFSQDGRTFFVIGPTLYEINTANATATSLGSIADDQKPVSFSTNGRGGEQLAIVGGGQLKILTLTTNVLSAAIALPLVNAPVLIDFMDGYFVMNELNTIRVWFSALEDGTSWDALDFFAPSETAGNVVGIKVLRNRIWVFQSQTASVYYDSGNALNPFVPYPGSVMQEGCVSAFSITVLGESIYWLSQDNQGRNRMVSASDYSPTVVSTPPISFALASYPILEDVEVLAYEQESHPFIVWTFPTGDHSWGLDTKAAMWHERSTYDSTTGQRHKWRSRGLCAANNLLLVGDYTSGNIYVLDLDTFDENGATIQRLRRAPYLSGENQWLFLDRVELGMQSGSGLLSGQGSAPVAMLRISRDAGETWGPPVTATLGAIGGYLANAIWTRLGRVRADRLVMEVTQTDPVRTVWGPGLWLKARPGSGEL